MSEVYQVGRWYEVPTVRAGYCGITGDWPVIGEFHTDAEIIKFSDWHWHLDARFVQKQLYQRIARRWSRQREPGYLERALPVMAHPSGLRFTPDSKPPIVLRRRKCVRTFIEAPFMDSALWMADLEAHYATKKLANGHCPHRGVDLSTLPVDRHGCVECPLHGLRWHVETGRMVPRKEWRAWDREAAQP